MTVQDVPLVDLNSPEFVRDPFPFYARLRQTAPVYRQPQGSWLVTRHRDCVSVLQDNRFVNLAEDRCVPDSSEGGRAADTPQSRMRRTAARALAPSLMRELDPVVRRTTDALIDAALDAGDVDVTEALGYPLGTGVFCDIFGIPAADRPTFQGWVDDLVHGVDLLVLDSPTLKARNSASRLEFFGYLWRLVGDRRRAPAGDLLSEILAIQRDHPELKDLDLISFCITLFIAGHASTSRFISFAVYALLRFPEQLRRLREHPELLPSAVEELLRHSTPMQFTSRAARTDLELAGQTIRRGEIVACVVGSANRDPEVFAEPDGLDLARSPNPHISFGYGHHYCLGAALSRLEGQLLLGELVRRAPALRLRGEPTYRPSVWLRGIAHLPVSLR
ncbi:MAG: cytochrome P450 [Micromonosporaceae bacterium]